MYCPKCGSKNEDNAAFCSSCGEKLNASQAAETAKGAPVVTTTATGSVTTGDGTTAKAAKKTGRTIGIIFAVVIVAAVVVTAIMTGGFGLMGPSIKGSVNDYSWDELSKISAEISKASDESGAIETAKKFNLTTADGKLDGTQVKDFTLKDGTDAQAQITGFYHDDKISGGKAGITFIFKDAFAAHDMNSDNTNVGGWKDSQMRLWLASDGLNLLPDDLKNAIVEVDKKTNNVGIPKDVSCVTTTTDKLWLYSAVELIGSLSASDLTHKGDNGAVYIAPLVYNAEGSMYQLFINEGLTIGGPKPLLQKTYEDESCFWWGRSPSTNVEDSFLAVQGNGSLELGAYASSDGGVVPGFCI